MNTIGKDRLPEWVKKVIGKRKCIEVKEHKGKYYCYQIKGIWDKNKKKSMKKSQYLGAIKPKGLQSAYEANLKGIYEYGHVRFLWDLLEKNGILNSLKNIFPEDWKMIFVFALNRLINPRPIKSINSWYVKTYLAKYFGISASPKRISKALERIGMNWKSMLGFFDSIKENGERIIYDRSVIFSSSKDNPLLEIGHNKEHLLLTKANIVLAFSHERFLPVFFRLVPGSIHEITTLNILLEEIGKNVILVLDKAFTSAKSFKDINKKARFIIPLKRDSSMIDYDTKLDSFFMYRKRPIKFAQYKHEKFYIYLYEDLTLKIEEEKTYFTLLSEKKKVEFKEKWAGKIALVSNRKFKSKEVYEMWKSRDQIEKAFDVLQNILDVDRPYVRKDETFRGYVFASFIGLIAYYLILKLLKEVEINDKTSVSDVLLELSKVYMIEFGKKEILSEKSKRVRKLIKALKIKNLLTKKGWS